MEKEQRKNIERRGGERPGRGKGQQRPLIFFIILIYQDFRRMISILTAILRKRGQTIIDLLGLQTLKVRFKERKRYTRWYRQLAIPQGPQTAVRPGIPTPDLQDGITAYIST